MSISPPLRFVAAVICLLSTTPAFSENLLPNPGFENGTAGWTLWRRAGGTATGEIDKTVKHSGAVSFKVSNPDGGPANLYSDNVPCRPGKPYTLTVWARTKDARRTSVALWGLDDKGGLVSHAIGGVTRLPANMDRFMRFSQSVTTPDNCSFLRAHLINSGGTVWWDSVEIRPGELVLDPPVPRFAPPPGSRNILLNSGFEEKDAGWQLWQQNPGEAASEFDTQNNVSGKYSFKIVNSGTGGANVFSEDVPCKPNTRYTLSFYAMTHNARRTAGTGWAVKKDGTTIAYGLDGRVEVPGNLSEFKRFHHTFTTPDDCARLRAHLVNYGGTVWWDCVQIEEGDAPTEYRDGLSFAKAAGLGRPEAVNYSQAIVRHAQATATFDEAVRLWRYLEAAGDRHEGVASKLRTAARLLQEAEVILQAERIAPDFMNLDYAAASAAMETAVRSAAAARDECLRVLGTEELHLEPVPPLEGMITPEKLASRLCIFPLLGMGRCWNAFFTGRYDWKILEPFDFRIIAPPAEGSGYRFDYVNKAVDACARAGYKSDLQIGVVRAVRSLFDKFGEEIYLHTSDGRWSDRGECHQMINIWHPEVLRVNNDYLTTLGRNFKDNENVVCYELINEPSLHVGKQAERFRSEHYGTGGYSKAARRAWPKFLRRKYGDIARLNKLWGSDYASFEAVEPPADCMVEPSEFPDPRVPLVIEFNRFRMRSHEEYFRGSIAALRKADPNHVVMPQFIASVFPRVEACDDLLGLGSLDWDFFSTHDWPGDKPAVTCLYAYSINRYIKKPMWEDEFIWPHWVQKGVDQRLVRAATRRNLWRMIAWGKRGIHLFNLENEWCAGSPDNWNNSILNVELGSRIVRFGTGAIKMVKDAAGPLAPVIFKTHIVNQRIAIIQPTTTLLSGKPYHASKRAANTICSRLLKMHWTPFFVPEECILDGREDLDNFDLIIVPYGVCAPAQLQDKLLEWTKKGGHLVLAGPFGVYDEFGRKSLHLLRETFGATGAAMSEKGRWQISLPAEKKPERSLLSRDCGKGTICLQTDGPVPLAELLSAAIPRKPVDCAQESVELILRSDEEGTRYLFAVNLDYGAAVRTEISFAGGFTKVTDMLARGAAVPARTREGRTFVPVTLAAGGTVLLKLRK